MYKDGLHEHSRLEEEYFYKKDRELIEKNKRETQFKKELLERTSHYHKCAKCGYGMQETVKAEIGLLICSNCECIQISLNALEELGRKGRLKNLAPEARELLIQWKKSA